MLARFTNSPIERYLLCSHVNARRLRAKLVSDERIYLAMFPPDEIDWYPQSFLEERELNLLRYEILSYPLIPRPSSLCTHPRELQFHAAYDRTLPAYTLALWLNLVSLTLWTNLTFPLTSALSRFNPRMLNFTHPGFWSGTEGVAWWPKWTSLG